jgi:ribosomal-protein-alanine N-acetyltransferase
MSSSIILQTEETLFGRVKAQKTQIPMWLDLTRAKMRPSKLQLVPVSGLEHWQMLRELRTQIEIPFGITDPKEIDALLREIKRIVETFQATWFLAKLGNETVGEIGLVEFKTENGTIGRLLDVDIAPAFQGRGHGNELLYAIFEVSRQRGVKALCLKTDSDRWVKDWYVKLGFEPYEAWPALSEQLPLSTDRMRLEPIEPSHADELCELFSDPELHQFVPFEPISVEKMRERCLRWSRRRSPDGSELWLNWLARDRSGQAVAHFQAGVKTDGVASIGYLVGKNHQNQGLASEGLKAVFEYLRNQLAVVEVKAWSDTRNVASHRVAKKLGMSQIELVKDADFFKGTSSDEYVFSRRL